MAFVCQAGTFGPTLIAMDSWLMDVSLASDNLKTQTIYCWVNKKYKIGFLEELLEHGGT
jgi:hypothetical protein